MNLHPTIKNLLGNERGNIMMTFGLTSMVAVAAIGGALDFGRAYNHKSKMQNALDAAVVSGVAKYRESNDWAAAKAEASAIFSAVFNNAVSPTTDAPNPTAGLDQPLVTFTQAGTQLAGSATLTANTPFMNLVIGTNLTVSANSSAVPPSGKILEVALMVDLTGSMGWTAATGTSTGTSAAAVGCETVANPTKKIDYLKCASEDLFNILLPANGANSDSVRIGVAPFADYVNAGEFAAEVTGKDETGGAYANGTNLAKTKQAATFSGTYSGWTAGTGTGNQFGAMGATATSGSTNTAAGAIFNNSYCANPGGQQATMHKRDGLTYGIQVPIASSNTYTGAAPTGLTKQSSGNYARANQWNVTYGAHFNYSGNLYWYSSTSSGYFAPMVSDPTSLTIQTRTADGHDGNVGVGVYYVGSSSNPTVPSYLKKNTGGFWRVTSIKTDGTFNYVWDDDSSSSEYTYYLPLYTSHTTGVAPGCESAVVAQPSSKLISCVTERVNGNNGSLDYTDDAPTTGKFIGPYNHGSTSRSNYSSDGKCYVAGRELPAVIPLTNDRSKLDTFVETATVGGAKRRLHNFGRCDEWNLCLTARTVVRANQEPE